MIFLSFVRTGFIGLSLITMGLAAQSQLSFTFSVTNTVGNVPGTFSGEIFGLTDNATSSATSVIIESIPVGMNNLVSTPIDAILWDTQQQNSFTVANGQVIAGGFEASQTISGFRQGYQLFLNGSPFNFLNLDGNDTKYVWGNDGLAAANFKPGSAASVPEPGSFAVMLSLGATGAVLAFKRKLRK